MEQTDPRAVHDDPMLAAVHALNRHRAFRLVTTPLMRPASVVTLGVLIGAVVPLEPLTQTPSFCPFKMMTGLPCPGCGMTRSVVALLHGDPSASWFFHPLGSVFLLLVLAVALVDAWVWLAAARQGRESSGSWVLERVVGTPLPWVAIGALAIVWVVRLPLYLAGSWVF